MFSRQDHASPCGGVRPTSYLLQVQGQSLWARLSASHGYLNKQGYCDGGNTLGSPSGNCHLFPVIWGETGTGFTVSHPLADLTNLADGRSVSRQGHASCCAVRTVGVTAC